MSKIIIGKQVVYKQVELDQNKNGTGIIIGGSGSGKTWLTTTLVNRLLDADAETEVKVLDLKESLVWRNVVKEGFTYYGGSVDSYFSVLKDTLKEVKQRETNQTSLPKKYIVLDEISALIAHLEGSSQEKELNTLLKELLHTSQSVGVYIILVGQRPVSDAILGTSLEKRGFKIGLRMDVKEDYDRVFGQDIITQVREPEYAGEAYVQVGSGEVNFVKLNSERPNYGS